MTGLLDTDSFEMNPCVARCLIVYIGDDAIVHLVKLILGGGIGYINP